MKVTPTRRTQPYRKQGKRPYGSALLAMRKGKPKYLRHPSDTKRRAQKRRRKLRRTRAY